MGVNTVSPRGAPELPTAGAATAARCGFAILRAPDAEPPATEWRVVRRRPGAAPSVPPTALTARTPGTTRPTPTQISGAAESRSATPVVGVHPDAHRFVLSTLRPMFEVLERRRPAKHLTVIASSTVVDVLKVLSETERAAITSWGRVHVAPPRVLAATAHSPRGDGDLGAEIFLTYRRGDRVLAAAGRVESTSGRWRWVAFTTAA